MRRSQRFDAILAMEVKGALVVKFPEARARALVEAQVGVPFDPGHGRPMKQRVLLTPDAPMDWGALAGEAFAYLSA